MKESRWWAGSIKPSPIVHLILDLNQFPKAICGQGELTVKWREILRTTLRSARLCQKCKKIYENLKTLAERGADPSCRLI
jgi:hypothetical protein